MSNQQSNNADSVNSEKTLKLLSPFQIGDLKLRNRVVMAPLTRGRAGKSRLANDLMKEYYIQRASAGLIISEGTHPSFMGIGWVGTPSIYTEEHAKAWKSITDAVHEKNGVIFCQLWHMGRQSHSSFLDGKHPVAPSAIGVTDGTPIHTPKGKEPRETPRALRTDEIPQVVQEFKHAAKMAKLAGFDGVEIHGANGYLIDQFLQARTNQRKDKYGGSIENRYRFLKEVVEAVLEVWPSNRVAVRISPNGTFGDMGTPEFRELFLYVAKELNKYNLGFLHIVIGLAFGFHKLGEPMTMSEFRKVYHGPMIANCGYTRDSGEDELQSDQADLIAYGRPYLSNPDLVERFANAWPLEDTLDFKLWYSGGAEGYTTFKPYNINQKQIKLVDSDDEKQNIEN